MKVGETFIPAGTARADHLHVVVSAPTDDGEVAVVNLTSKRGDSDTCCVIDVGEHPWVRHESVALYSHALMIPVQQLAKGLQANVLKPHDDVTEEILMRIQGGALECEQTPPLVVEAVHATIGS